MAAVVEVASPNGDAPECSARRIFGSVPDVAIELERFVPLGGRAVPYVWVWGETLDAFERALDRCPDVGAVERLERVEGGCLYRIEWDVDAPLIHCVRRSGGTLLSAHGTAERWKLRVLFDSGEAASGFQRCCADRDVPIRIDRLRTTIDREEEAVPSLTTPQREALRAAYENGYFERPRAATQEDLAEHLGISAAAVGNRLRRGTATLVEEALF